MIQCTQANATANESHFKIYEKMKFETTTETVYTQPPDDDKIFISYGDNKE